MRISTNQLFDSSVQSVNTSLSEAVNFQQQISSGQKYTKASDNAYAVSWGVRLSFDKSRLDMFAANQKTVAASMDQAATSLGSVIDQMNQLTSISVQAQNGSLTPTAKQALYLQALQIATTIQGQAGATDASGNPVFPTSVNQVSIEPGVVVASGIVYADAFGGAADLTKVNVTTKLNEFVTYLSQLASGTTPTTNTNATVTSGLTSAYNQLQNAQTVSGLVGSLVSQASSAVNSLGTQLASTTSNLLDTDMAAATAGFMKSQTILSAAQSLFSRLQSSNLFSKL